MTEIKFRAWISLGKNINPLMREVDTIHIDERYIEVETDSERYGFENIILMQYVGLKDKNGVEIYENDLVKTPRGIGEVRYTGDACYEVKYINGWGGITYNSEVIAEVIGNVFEKPEEAL